jgi:hypothetical protein
VGLLYQFLVRLIGLVLKILWSFGETLIFPKFSSRILISSSVDESVSLELDSSELSDSVSECFKTFLPLSWFMMQALLIVEELASRTEVVSQAALRRLIPKSISSIFSKFFWLLVLN